MFLMKVSAFASVVFWLAFPAPASAEDRELTQEYREARTSVVKELRGIYRECTGKIGNRYYSEFLSSCINDPEVKIRKERCGHEAQLATERFLIVEKGAASCEHLNPATEDYKKRLEEIVKKRNIEMYE